jgi:phage/plasmid-like protein (TIGR03299 family)
MTEPTTKLTAEAQKFIQVKGSAFDPTEKVWGTGGWDAIERKVTHGIQGNDFAAVGYQAWHELGTVAPQGTTAPELFKLAGADWDAFHAPVLTEVQVPATQEDGSPLWVPGYRDPATGERVQQTKLMKAEDPNARNVCRINPHTGALEILGQTSAKYGIIQHRTLFLDFAEGLLNLTDPAVATCGVLFGGKQVFMCWKLPESISVDGVDDALQLWLLARTSHDRSIPAQVAITPVRTVCFNTTRWNIANAVSKMSIRHTRNAQASLEQAREALGMTNKYGEALGREARMLLSTPMSLGKFEQVVTKAFGPGDEPSKKAADEWDTKMAKLIELWKAPTQDSGRDTAWGALNTVIEYQDWNTRYQNKSAGIGEVGGRFWRSITDNPDVTNPKLRMVAALREYAGIDEKQLVRA